MITINSYVKPESLEEAYELNQKRANRILGGMMWMRLGSGRVQTAIDLSGMGLDQIEESEEEFKIGCMCTLRQLELHKGINQYTDGAVRECVRHIVGVQFRNQATVGGSIFGRFGFSDVLTCFLAMDCYVELYKGGIVPLREFVCQKRDRDILVNVIIRKDVRKIRYVSSRRTKTDFPVIACGVAKAGEEWQVSVGARPMKAVLVTEKADGRNAAEIAEKLTEQVTFGSNMRGSSVYRKALAKVLIRRQIEALMEEC